MFDRAVRVQRGGLHRIRGDAVALGWRLGLCRLAAPARPAAVYADREAAAGAQLIDLRDGAVWADGSLTVKMQTEVVVFTWLAPTAPTDDDALRDATVAVATKALRGYIKP
jgi:hypothetical protein